MADDNREIMRDIGDSLQDRLTLDHSLPAIFVSLLADLDVAEDSVKRLDASPPTLHDN